MRSIIFRTTFGATADRTIFWCWVLSALAIAHLAIMLATPVPPLLDYPGHLARIHVMTELNSSPDLQRYYEYNWALAPNLGVDLVVYVLAHVMPIELAGKLVVGVIPGLTLLGVALVRLKAFGRIDGMVLLSAPFAMGKWFGWGFLNFVLATALALIAFAVWLSIREKPLVWRAGILCALGIIVWTTHIFGWAELGLLVVSWELVHAPVGLSLGGNWRDTGASIIRRAWRAILASSPLLAPLLLMVHGGAQGPAPEFPPIDGNTLWFKNHEIMSALSFTWDHADTLCVVLIVVVALAAVATRLATVSLGLLIAASAAFLVFILAPTAMMNARNVDVRMTTPVFLFATSMLAWNPVANAEWTRRGAHAFASGFVFAGLITLAAAIEVGRLAYSAVIINSYRAELVRVLDLVDSIPKGARVLVFVVDYPHPRKPPVAHLSSMAVVRRNASSNWLWEADQGQPLRLKYIHDEVRPFQNQSVFLGADLARLVKAAPVESFDYVWIGNADLAPPLTDSRMELVASAGSSTVFRVIAPEALDQDMSDAP